MNKERRNINETKIKREKAAKESCYKYKPTQKEINEDRLVTDAPDKQGDPVTESDIRKQKGLHRIPYEDLKKTRKEKRKEEREEEK